MKVSEIIQRVESLMAKGISMSIDGGYISRRWIYNLMIGFRAKILGQEINKKQRISDWNKQTLSCVKLIDASIDECECVTGGVCKIKRTENKLPEFMLGLSEYAVDSIYNSNMTIKIDLKKYNESKYARYSKYTSKRPSAFIHNGYMYVEGLDHANCINITALFEDPLEVEKFNAENNICDNTKHICPECISPLDIEFPIDNDKIDTVVMLVVNEISMAFLRNNQQQDKEQQNEKQPER